MTEREARALAYRTKMADHTPLVERYDTTTPKVGANYVSAGGLHLVVKRVVKAEITVEVERRVRGRIDKRTRIIPTADWARFSSPYCVQ